MYYPELSHYALFQSVSDQAILAVGWLDSSHKYPHGAVSAAFIDRLWTCCQSPVMRTKGFYPCELCSDPEPFLQAHHGDQSRWLGSAEMWVRGSNGTVYATPNLIFHYVVDHGYLPPAEFIAAVLHGTALSEDDVLALYR